MNRHSVESTNILSVGYDEEKELLEIEFKLKIVHHYHSVPLSEFIALMKAEPIEDYYFNYVQSMYHFDSL